jgi:hypothetical protein
VRLLVLVTIRTDLFIYLFIHLFVIRLIKRLLTQITESWSYKIITSDWKDTQGNDRGLIRRTEEN